MTTTLSNRLALERRRAFAGKATERQLFHAALAADLHKRAREYYEEHLEKTRGAGQQRGLFDYIYAPRQPGDPPPP